MCVCVCVCVWGGGGGGGGCRTWSKEELPKFWERFGSYFEHKKNHEFSEVPFSMY